MNLLFEAANSGFGWPDTLVLIAFFAFMYLMTR